MADRNILKEDRIQDYIDDRLNERDRASVAAYLLANPDVDNAVERLRRQNEALKAIGQFQFENDRQQRPGVFFWQRSTDTIMLPRLADNERSAVRVWIEGGFSIAPIADRGNPDFDAIADDVSAFYRQALTTTTQ
jgi:anti-sigma factor RsiW